MPIDVAYVKKYKKRVTFFENCFLGGGKNCQGSFIGIGNWEITRET